LKKFTWRATNKQTKEKNDEKQAGDWAIKNGGID